VIIDPLTAFLGGEINAHRDQDVRRALYPLKLMAESTGAAVLVVRHLSKSGDANPLYRGGGSIGIIAAARLGLLVAPDPDDPDPNGRRILAVTKSNLAAKPPALAYRVVEDELHGCVRITWEGTTRHSAADLLGRPLPERPSPQQDAAEAFLAQQLAKGPRQVADLRDLADARGLAWRTIQRAAGDLEVKVERRPEPGKRGRGPSWWSLPNTRQEVRATSKHSPDGAYAGEGNAQVSKPEEAGNEIRANAPTLLDHLDPDDPRRTP
jgi:AAA domain